MTWRSSRTGAFPSAGNRQGTHPPRPRRSPSGPFYAEGGGQLADAGTITATGGKINVFDVQTPLAGLIVHRGKVTSGQVTANEPAFAEIDVERRRALSRSHTATHMVHRALRGALGESAAQAGSENAPGKLRFDFHAS